MPQESERYVADPTPLTSLTSRKNPSPSPKYSVVKSSEKLVTTRSTIASPFASPSATPIPAWAAPPASKAAPDHRPISLNTPPPSLRNR